MNYSYSQMSSQEKGTCTNMHTQGKEKWVRKIQLIVEELEFWRQRTRERKWRGGGKEQSILEIYMKIQVVSH